MVCLGPGDVTLGACDFFFRVVYGGLRFIDLGNEFRNLQDGKYLSLMNVVPNVNVDVPDIAGHLGMQLDVLVGDKLAGNRKRIGNRLLLHRRNGGVRYMLVVCAAAAWRTGPHSPRDQDGNQETHNHEC